MYVVLLLVLESVYGWALFAVPGLRAIATFGLFTLLMVTHVSLHLAAPRLPAGRWWSLAYFLIQAGLAVAITWMTRTAEAPFALYLFAALAGQSVALAAGNLRVAAWPVGVFVILGLAGYVHWWGWSGLLPFFVVAAPQAFFVVAFVYLFVRQAKGRREAQALLQDLERAHRELSA